jgi:hypothetical protein
MTTITNNKLGRALKGSGRGLFKVLLLSQHVSGYNNCNIPTIQNGKKNIFEGSEQVLTKPAPRKVSTRDPLDEKTVMEELILYSILH